MGFGIKWLGLPLFRCLTRSDRLYLEVFLVVTRFTDTYTAIGGMTVRNKCRQETF